MTTDLRNILSEALLKELRSHPILPCQNVSKYVFCGVNCKLFLRYPSCSQGSKQGQLAVMVD